MIRSSPSGLLVRLFVALLLLAPSLAGAQTPNQDQIEAFRNLPADQQQAVLEALGQDGSSGKLPSSVLDRATRRLGYERLPPVPGRTTVSYAPSHS